MEHLPNHMKINIMNYIPRRIHPASIIMREAIDECIEYCADVELSDSWGAWWYEYRILATNRNKFECDYADDYDENEH